MLSDKNIIKDAAKFAGQNPGIYKMINHDDKIIYIGKAKSLQNRLMSYTKTEKMPNRLKMMVSNIAKIETIITGSEIEALLLENNLIKEHKPFYNILLKDDKSFPYIVIDNEHDFPRIFKYRTKKPASKNFFGPYPAISSLDETLKVIQKTFLLRTCTDAVFANRDRPCLQYFIKRCSGPCVSKISKESYMKNVSLAKQLLDGKDESARATLVSEMNSASKSMDFEMAAIIRDRIKALSEIQSKQYIEIENKQSIDFIAIYQNSEYFSIFVFFFRLGRNVGSQSSILNSPTEDASIKYVLENFIFQFYQNIPPPKQIITSHEVGSQSIQEVLKTRISVGSNGEYKKIILNALQNAQQNLQKEIGNQYSKELSCLANVLKMNSINRIEVYDNSHISGTSACSAMVVFEDGKFQKSKYRKFNISKDIANNGDDLSMMRYALRKRLTSKTIKSLPDLILIDGGSTQFQAASDILEELKLIEKIRIISIAKQNNRTIGDEKILISKSEELPVDEFLLHFLIMLRDEAHKEALFFHRKKRTKTMSKSQLDDIFSIGMARKRKLLEHFGSIDAIKKATLDDLVRVNGINLKEAQIIVDFFKNNAKKR